MSNTIEDSKRLARRFPEDVATEGNTALIDEIVTEEFVEHNAFGGDVQGRSAAKDQIRALRNAFLDLEATVEEIIAEGDLVAMRVRIQGTHDGPFMGLEPTGNAFEIQNMIFTRIEEGLIAERWIQPDMMGMLQQLEVLPRNPAQFAQTAED